MDAILRWFNSGKRSFPTCVPERSLGTRAISTWSFGESLVRRRFRGRLVDERRTVVVFPCHTQFLAELAVLVFRIQVHRNDVRRYRRDVHEGVVIGRHDLLDG